MPSKEPAPENPLPSSAKTATAWAVAAVLAIAGILAFQIWGPGILQKTQLALTTAVTRELAYKCEHPAAPKVVSDVEACVAGTPTRAADIIAARSSNQLLSSTLLCLAFEIPGMIVGSIAINWSVKRSFANRLGAKPAAAD